MDLVRFENHGASNTICPEASSVDSQWFAVEGAMPISRARSALLSKFAERRAQARRKRSKSRRRPTLLEMLLIGNYTHNPVNQ